MNLVLSDASVCSPIAENMSADMASSLLFASLHAPSNGQAPLFFKQESLSEFPTLLAIFDRYLAESRYEKTPDGIKIYAPTSFHVSGLRRCELELRSFFGQEILSIEVRRVAHSNGAQRTQATEQSQTTLSFPNRQGNTVSAGAARNFLVLDRNENNAVEIERKRRQSPPDLVSSKAFETPIALTRRWCEAVSNGARSQVLWVHGKPGTGKTALLKQLHSWVGLQHRMEFVDVMKFFQEWRRALEAKDTPRFTRKYRKETKVFVLENLDELEGKIRTQEEVLFTINAILEHGGSIAVSSFKHPIQLKETLGEALFSRLFSGMMIDMPAPDRGLKENLWRKLLNTHGMGDAALDVTVSEYLLSMEVDSIRKAHTLYVNAVSRISINGSLTQADLKELEYLHGAATKNTNINQAPTETLDKVAALCGVTRAAILGRVRRSDISLARRFVSLALARFNGLTNSAIATLIEKDPSTVSHGLKTIEDEIRSQRHVEEQWNWICSKMGVAPSR